MLAGGNYGRFKFSPAIKWDGVGIENHDGHGYHYGGANGPCGRSRFLVGRIRGRSLAARGAPFSLTRHSASKGTGHRPDWFSALWTGGHGGGGPPPTPATPPCVRVRTRRFE